MRRAVALGAVLLASLPAWAHVGSPDVYVKAQAGPYALLVSVHPPAAVPGAAEVDVRSENEGISTVEVSIEGAESGAEPLKRFAAGGAVFTGSVWVASAGAWRVRVHVSGAAGEGDASVPVPGAVAGAGASGLNGWGLAGLIAFSIALSFATGFFLGSGEQTRLTGAVLAASVVVFVAMAWVGVGSPVGPPAMGVVLQPGGRLVLSLPGKADGLVADHGHMLHLFAVRQPEMDVLLHLHPEQIAPGRFEAELPSMAPGAFALYADVVRADGTPETFVARVGLPFRVGGTLTGDDAVGVVPGLARSDVTADSAQLADGYRMTFKRPAALRSKVGELLRFELLDSRGNPPADMELYMGMAAHAAVVKTDGSVFAHIHPAGNIPMAAYGMRMAGMEMRTEPANEVAFPFGFPSAGRYRIFVEMKHGRTVETGAFDVAVE